MPATALGGTAILTTSGESSWLVAGAAVGEFDLLLPKCGRRRPASSRRDAHAAALLQLGLNLIGEPVDFRLVPSTRTTRCGVLGRFRLAGCASSSAPASRTKQVIDGDGRRGEIGEAIEQNFGGGDIGTRGDDRGRAFRQRFHFERELRDDAERAERAGEQLAEVVAGDVLHDAAAAFERDAAAIDGVDADHVVADRAVAVAARAVPVRGHHAAERGFAGARHVDRQMLAFGGERRGEIGHPHAGFDEDRHVARRVVDDCG